MIRMMVVEDETILREGICRVGDWERCDVEICAAVSNGQEALTQISVNKPDIILTDVVMPVMDGLELTRRVYEQYPEIKIILLSGHEEFEYVKKAMDCKACNYLLKPAKIELLVEVVCAVRDEILKERSHSREKERLQKKLEESIPIVREHYMNQLLNEVECGEAEIARQFEFLNIDLETDHVAVLVGEMDWRTEDRTDLRIALLQLGEICLEVIQREYHCVVFEDLKDRIVIVLNYPENMRGKDFLLYLQGKAVRIQKEMQQRTGQLVSFGIGRLIPNIRYLPKAYKEAECALNYRFFMGRESVIYIGDIEREEHKDWFAVLSQEEELTECIKVGDIEGTKQQLERYFELLGQFSAAGQDSILNQITVFVSYLLRFLGIKEMGGERNWLMELEKLSEDLRDKNQYPTLKELKNKVCEVVLQAAEKINQNRILRNEGIIEKAQRYIRQNLSGDVSLIAVAENVYVSPNYLSFLFRENGENFKDYVVRIKMERAKEMMDSQSYTLNQIAAELGYKDGRYLSQVYKKYYEK